MLRREKSKRMSKIKGGYLTCFQAAEQLGFSPDHVRRLIIQGKIKATKLGNFWLILPKDIAHVTRKRKSPLKEA